MTGKRTTSLDVARLAGVSRSVVSAVINGTQGIGVSSVKREAVLRAMHELNYHVDAGARAMKTGRSNCIAAFGDMSNLLFLQLIEGIQQASARLGYHVLLVGQHGEGETAREELISLYLQRRVDGIISLDHLGYQNETWMEWVREHDIPYISVEGYAKTDVVCSVLADYYGSVQTALEYMTQEQSEPPVFFQLEDDSSSNWAEEARLAAYYDFCEVNGIQPEVCTVHYNNKVIIRELLELRIQQGSSMVFLTNWMSAAIQFYRAAAELGLRIGRDLKVMSADNTFRVSHHLHPKLSVMAVPYQEMGAKALELLDQRINQEAPESNKGEMAANYWVKARLIPGDSD